MEKSNNSPFEGWGLGKLERPLVIAGPCSAESEEQVVETATQLKTLGIEVFRAGIWKPRTRPNQFEGVGISGLEWMKRVQKEVGMKVSTEVGNVKHVYDSLRHGVDIIWIGARTSADPFAMQEIADALRGVDIPVLVKNPVNPDLNLWIGAIERISAAGIRRVGAIHRGFSTYDTTRYRNIPQWQVPIELKQKMPEIPMICDPSHMGGKRELIQELSQKALDLNYDGLMIESHFYPAIAKSDSEQQITPSELGTILNSLIIRDPSNDNPLLMFTLEELRHKIDVCDEKLIKILNDRMTIAETIGSYKKENKITILQSARWKEVVEKIVEKGKKYKLSEEMINTIFKAIHQESINRQTTIMNKS